MLHRTVQYDMAYLLSKPLYLEEQLNETMINKHYMTRIPQIAIRIPQNRPIGRKYALEKSKHMLQKKIDTEIDEIIPNDYNECIMCGV